ncbi:hypothetical protein [Solwaraspora sp. WMMD792]|uniref:hypothetical protein n=1 Tax=Solwaraspora sp. WMMD792 TaxID=3016099 RepID=UPI00241651D4|nr:hypothetical protein [Solwaraspora sp. WMMD792]MDG4768937.1 hypothetical protein [Solwaraspora sp. WMMD792]MDG4769012.1 hypothetical protein [Solwaraspora sp. WMMD792]
MTFTGELTDDLVELPPGYYLDRWRGTGAWCTLPWPEDLADLPPSLGPQIIGWAEWRTYDRTGVPGLVDHQTGRRWVYTPGQRRYMHVWYAYDPRTGRWLYRRAVKRGAKGTGKDPFGASLCDAELIGPTRLVNRDGRWVGVRHRMPLVQIASNSEAQSKDVLRVANAMLCQETRDFFGIDCGETRTILKESGGRLEILTASEKTAEGDPATFVLLNESHHMTESSGGHKVAAVARRNVGKSPKDLQARLCEMTNAHQQGGDSEAERSYEAWQKQVSGQAKRRDILYDSIEAPPTTDLYDDASRMAGLRAAYMDAPWADLERLSDEMLDPSTSEADSIRYYLSGLATAEDAWIDPRRFDELARPGLVVADREQLALFLDCSKSTDATGLVGARISDGHVITLGVWQRPHGDRGKGWLAPRHEVDAAVRAAFDRYRVVWCGIDPSPARDDEDESLYWMEMIDGLHRDFRRKLPVWATPGTRGHSVLFDMRIKTPGAVERNRLFTQSAMQCAADIDEHGTLTHDGKAALRMHVHAARRRPNPWGVSLGKITRDSTKLVDLAVCMVGARMGRRLALNSGKVRVRRAGAGKAVF